MLAEFAKHAINDSCISRRETSRTFTCYSDGKPTYANGKEHATLHCLKLVLEEEFLLQLPVPRQSLDRIVPAFRGLSSLRQL